MHIQENKVEFKKVIVAAVIIWIAGFLAYSNSFTIAFQFDDLHTIQSNLSIRSLANIPRFFVDANTYSYRPENSGYRPMTTLFASLGFALSSLETWGYHLIKLIEHCLLATLLMVMGLRFIPVSNEKDRFIVAFFSGLLFVVHRINTEVVDYLSAASTLQATLFLFTGFYLYLRSKEVEGKQKIAFYIASVFTYFLSMLSKEEGVTLPAVIFLYECIFSEEQMNRSRFFSYFKKILPYILVAIFYVILRTTFQSADADKSRGDASAFIYFITQLRSWLYYWFLYFWPMKLNSDNLSFEFSKGLDDWRIWGALMVHVAVISGAWWGFRKYKNRFVFFTVLSMYITVLPASSVFVLVEAVNEHRAYSPYLFLTLLSVWGAFEIGKKFKFSYYGVSAAMACIVVAMGIGTFERNKVWQTDISLWQDVYSKNPDSVRAMSILGVSQLNQGVFDESAKLLERCHRINPTFLPCIVHLSMAYSFLKRFDEGLALLQYGRQVDPHYPHVNYHLGIYYKEHFANFDFARSHFELALKDSSGRFFQAVIKLAEIDLEEKNIQQAIDRAGSILRADKTNGDAWEIYGKARMLAGDLVGAAQIFNKLYEVAPNSYRYSLNAGNIAERQGQFDRALVLYQKTIQLMPETIQAWSGLARVGAQLKRPDISTEAQRQVQALKTSKKWFFIPSVFMTGESFKQIVP